MGIAFGTKALRGGQLFALRGLDMPRHIGIVVFSGFGLAGAVGVIELLRTANAVEQRASGNAGFYVPVLLSESGGGIGSDEGVVVGSEKLLPGLRAPRFRALFVAGGSGVATAMGCARLRAWLREQHDRGTWVVPIGEGRELVEAAGVFAPAAADSGAPRAAALAMIESDLGEVVARHLALQSAPAEARGESQVLRPVVQARISEQILVSARWLEANHERPISVADAAQAVAMSERNFLRRFKLELGMTPSDYLLGIRLRRSCRLLAETDLPIDKIARRCGIGDGGRMAKVFRKYLANTPSEYRAGLQAAASCGQPRMEWRR